MGERVVLPSVRDIQDVVTHDQENEFDGVTLAELWGNAVSDLPEIRKCHLEDDQTALFREVYVTLLQANQIGHSHVIRYLATDTAHWLQTFADKIDQLIPGEIYKRKVVAAPRFPDKIEHGWRN